MAANATAILTVKLRDLVTGPAKGIKQAFGGVRERFAKLKGGFDLAGNIGLAASAVGQLGSQSKSILTSVLQPALDFEEAITRVGAVTVGSTAEDFKKLRDAALEMGRTTRYSAADSANGLYSLATAGLTAAEQISALPVVMKLTQASGSEMGRVSEMLTDMVGAFGKKFEDSNEIAQVMTATFSASTTSLEDLYSTMKYAATAATSVGVSLQQVATLTALLGNAGIKGEMGGTALRTMLLSLASPSREAKKALKAVGLSAADIEENLKNPVILLNKLDYAFQKKNLSEVKRLRVLDLLFGREGVPSVTALIQAMNKVGADGKTAFERVNKAVVEGNGELDRMNKIFESTDLAKVRNLDSAMEALKITVAEKLAPAFRKMVDDLTELVGKFADWANKNPEVVATLGKVLLGVAAFSAVVVPILLTISGLVSAFTLLKGAILLLNAPIHLAIGAFTGLKASLIALSASSTIARTALLGLRAVLGVVGAAFIGWEVGKALDALIGKVFKLRGELLSTEIAMKLGESDKLSNYLADFGRMYGIQTLVDIGEGNKRRTAAELEAYQRGQAGAVGNWNTTRGEAAQTMSTAPSLWPSATQKVGVDGTISIEVEDNRTRVKKITQSSAGPTLEVGYTGYTP